MGNTVAYESQAAQEAGDESKDRNINLEGSSSDSKRIRSRHVECYYPKGLEIKASSFLAEPVTTKLTDRGDTTMSVSASENAYDGKEGHGIDTSNRDKLRYAVSEMQGWRSHMEDKYLLNPNLSSCSRQEQLLKDHHLFAVFDGHGGDYTSHFCGENFVSTLTGQKDWKTYLKLSSKVLNKNGRRRPTQESVIGLQLLKSALTATFLELDVKLMEAQRERRLSQLSNLEDLLYSLAGDVEFDVFQPGTDDHNSVMNFAKQLPENVPFNVPLERSGSTGVVVLITPSHILCANAGDSRAILSKKSDESSSDALPLSFDHKPSNDVELCRVEKDGGFVRTKRVDGSLAVSRGFGDFEYKNRATRDDNNADDTSSSSDNSSYVKKNRLQKDSRVTVHPDIIVHTRDSDEDEFVVLACDGIWDRLSNRECADLVRDLAHDEGEMDVGLICEEVIDTALELDSRDNMTCCVIFFPDANHDDSLDMADGGGVLKRRIDREESRDSDSTPAPRAQLREVERRKKKRDLTGPQRSKEPKGQVRRQRRQGEMQLSLDREGEKRGHRGNHLIFIQNGKKHKASDALLLNASRKISR